MNSWHDIVTAVRSIASQVSIGGDLTQVSLPAAFCFPHSTVRLLAEKRMAGQELLPLICSIDSKFIRMLTVIKWLLSASIVDEQFGKKPLNPVLGETFLCQCDDLIYVGEQVSHHPPITAFHMEHFKYNISFDGTSHVVAQFLGNSVGVEIKGKARLRIDLNKLEKSKDHLESFGVQNIIRTEESEKEDEHNYEDYIFDPGLPKGYARGLLVGSQYYELGGNSVIICEKSGYRCELEFKLSRFFSSKRNELVGKIIEIETNSIIAKLSGFWDKKLKVKSSLKHIQDEIDKHFKDGIFFDFKDIIPAGPIKPLQHHQEELRKFHSSSIWNLVTKAIQEDDYQTADKEKLIVENEQREYIKQLKTNDKTHNHHFFDKCDDLGYKFIPQLPQNED